MMKINDTRYTMLKMAIRQVLDDMGCEKVHVELTSLAFESNLRFGVHWSAPGTVSAEEASTWAAGVAKASAIAKVLNQADLDLNGNKDPHINWETWEEQFELIKGFIRDGEYGWIGRWIYEGNI